VVVDSKEFFMLFIVSKSQPVVKGGGGNGCRMQDAESWMLDAGWWGGDAISHRLPRTREMILKAEYRDLVPRSPVIGSSSVYIRVNQ